MAEPTKHVVMFSGGIGSWAAAKRVAERHGADNMTLLFSDTLMEDEDLYRFLDEGAANVGAHLVRISEGRNPWQVFFDERMLGNSRFDPCSKILKRRMVDRWLSENCDPAATTVHVGIDWSEEHRFTGLRDRRAADGWRYEAPMCDAPYMMKPDMLRWLKEEGIRPPRLYEMGFAHNNCGGFCVKAGKAHFANLLRTMPERYARHEAKELEIIAYLGRDDISILADHKRVKLPTLRWVTDEGGSQSVQTHETIRTPVTLRDFRLRIEAGGQYDLFEIGGCGCFAVGETEAA